MAAGQESSSCTTLLDHNCSIKVRHQLSTGITPHREGHVGEHQEKNTFPQENSLQAFIVSGFDCWISLFAWKSSSLPMLSAPQGVPEMFFYLKQTGHTQCHGSQESNAAGLELKKIIALCAID